MKKIILILTLIVAVFIYKEVKRYKALRDLVFIVKKEQIKEEVKTKQLNFFDK